MLTPLVSFASLRLATTLYSEQLVDRDHYLDWVIVGLESSPQGKLPIWILIAQLYWADLLQMRKYGRRLVFALLSQANSVSHAFPSLFLLNLLASPLI
jgi:mediator of RNA polymerase II transcription subunit 12